MSEEKIFAINLIHDNHGKVRNYKVKMTSLSQDVSLASAVLIDQVSARSKQSRTKLVFMLIYKLIRINLNARKAVFKSWITRRSATKMALQTENINDKIKKKHENIRSN